MKISVSTASLAAAMIAFGFAAAAQDERLCVQGTYSTPCAKVVWCPAGKCGIGIPQADGSIDILYSSEKTMDGTKRRPYHGGQPMSLQNVMGKIIVFEWDDGTVPNPASDLNIKDVIHVVMPPPGSG